MQVNELLAQMGGLQSMARELGITEQQAESGAAALLPAILGGFKKQAQTQPSGLAGLGSLLGRLGGGGLLDNVLAPRPTDVSRGNNVLGQIFGSKDVSRAVADNAATKCGCNGALLRRMLPMLAMLVAGYMAKQRFGGAARQSAPAGSGLRGMLGRVAGGVFGGRQPQQPVAETPEDSDPQLADMLDLDREANPLDDILQMVAAGKR